MHMLEQPHVVCVHHMSMYLHTRELLFELSTWERTQRNMPV